MLRAADRVIACLDGLSGEEAAWRPDAPNANSVATIVSHVLANLEENVFSVIGGNPSARDRVNEFDDAVSPAALQERWAQLRPRVDQALRALNDSDLLRQCQHPRRGAVTVGEMLVVIRGHLGEHEGQSALTRDMAIARRESR